MVFHSFSTIVERMGWGERSKFAEQIYAEQSEERHAARGSTYGIAEFFPIQG